MQIGENSRERSKRTDLIKGAEELCGNMNGILPPDYRDFFF